MIKPDYAVAPLDYTQLINTLLYNDYIDANYQLNTITTDPASANRHRGNLFGLFTVMNIDVKYHLYTMIANGYHSPFEYDGKQMTFKIPNVDAIDQVLNLMS